MRCHRRVRERGKWGGWERFGENARSHSTVGAYNADNVDVLYTQLVLNGH